MRHGGCDDLVKEFWSGKIISNFGEIADGLKQYGDRLSRWNKEVFERVG